MTDDDKNFREMTSAEEQVLDRRMERQLTTEAKGLGRYEYFMIRRAVIYASNPEKMNDTIRLELIDGRVITIRGAWGSAEVTDSKQEGH